MDQRLPSVDAQGQIRALDRPDDPEVMRLFELWQAKRGPRLVPARADFDPSEFKPLLPYILLVDLLPPPDHYRVRLAGEAINEFYGRSLIGRFPREYLSPDALAAFLKVLEQIVATRQPAFRAGRTYWQRDKSYKPFESCLLPLGADGSNVDMVLAALMYR